MKRHRDGTELDLFTCLTAIVDQVRATGAKRFGLGLVTYRIARRAVRETCHTVTRDGRFEYCGVMFFPKADGPEIPCWETEDELAKKELMSALEGE